MEPTLYFDNAATTYPKPECVYQKMDEVNRTLAVNAGRGSYTLAKNASAMIEETRSELLKLIHAEQVAEVVLTASATIALNQIIGGLTFDKNSHIYVSPFEHNAVMRTLYKRICSDVDTVNCSGSNVSGTDVGGINNSSMIASGEKTKLGMNLQQEISVIDRLELTKHFHVLPVHEVEGQYEIDLERSDYLFSKYPPTHIFLTNVSNVTGYILPVKELFDMAKEYHAVTVMDASQSLGLLPIDMTKLSADYIVFAGHKTVYGPFGIGGFFLRKGCKLDTFLAGGTGTDSLNLNMPVEGSSRYEPASPNAVAAAGLLASLRQLDQPKILQHELMLTQLLRTQLQKIRDVKLYLPPEEAHVGIVAFNLRHLQSSEVGKILDEDYHIAVRTGYHCAPLIHEKLRDQSQAGVVRASVGQFTTEEEIAAFVKAVKEIAEG